MKFQCEIRRRADGGWTLRYDGSDLSPIEVHGPSRQAVEEKMKSELRYRLELCPCSGESYQHLQIDLVEQPAG
jgi:hypothetical protein